MPTTDSNLTGTFIANTYQKLLQVDNINGSVGTTAPFDPTVANNTSKYTLLNGLGQSVGGVVIDQTGVSGFNGGLFLKNTSTGANNDGKGSWTLQTSGDGGLNISRNSDDNYLFFLKQSGSAFVGYKNATIPADISGYSLYVNDGIVSGERERTKRHHGIPLKDSSNNEVCPLFISLVAYSNGTGNYPDYGLQGNVLANPFRSQGLNTSSYARTPLFGVTRDEHVLISGYTRIYGTGYNNGAYFRVINARQNSPWISQNFSTYGPSVTNANFVDIFSGGSGGNNGYYEVEYNWVRLGNIVHVGFKLRDMIGFEVGADYEYVFLPLPVVPLDSIGGSIKCPSDFKIFGSGAFQNQAEYFEAAEIKGDDYLGLPVLKLSIGQFDNGASEQGGTPDVRGHFSYVLFDEYTTPTQNISISDPNFSKFPGD